MWSHFNGERESSACAYVFSVWLLPRLAPMLDVLIINTCMSTTTQQNPHTQSGAASHTQANAHINHNDVPAHTKQSSQRRVDNVRRMVNWQHKLADNLFCSEHNTFIYTRSFVCVCVCWCRLRSPLCIEFYWIEKIDRSDRITGYAADAGVNILRKVIRRSRSVNFLCPLPIERGWQRLADKRQHDPVKRAPGVLLYGFNYRHTERTPKII